MTKTGEDKIQDIKRIIVSIFFFIINKGILELHTSCYNIQSSIYVTDFYNKGPNPQIGKGYKILKDKGSEGSKLKADVLSSSFF